MFTNPLWQQLHTKIARYIAPYDAAVRPDSLARRRAWIAPAEAQHQQVLVAFYHSEYTPTKLPSVAAYQQRRAEIRRSSSRTSSQYQSWDEANRGNVPRAFSSPSAGAAAKYYQALKRVCKGCTVIGLDVLDAGQHHARRCATSRNSSARSAPAHGHADDLGPAQLLRHQPPGKLAHARTGRARSAARCG